MAINIRIFWSFEKVNVLVFFNLSSLIPTNMEIKNKKLPFREAFVENNGFEPIARSENRKPLEIHWGVFSISEIGKLSDVFCGAFAFPHTIRNRKAVGY
jgi:hypothetical protein